MRQGRIDFKGLAGNPFLFIGRHVFHGPHIMQTVRKLDQDHADILCHGKEHLPIVFDLLLLAGNIFNLAEFGDAIDESCHFKAKNIGQLVEGHIRIFHHIMEEGGSKGRIIHMKLGQDACYPQRMDDVGFTAGPFLAGMLLRRKIIGLPDELHLARGQIFPDSHIKFLCTDWCCI